MPGSLARALQENNYLQPVSNALQQALNERNKSRFLESAASASSGINQQFQPKPTDTTNLNAPNSLTTSNINLNVPQATNLSTLPENTQGLGLNIKQPNLTGTSLVGGMPLTPSTPKLTFPQNFSNVPTPAPGIIPVDRKIAEQHANDIMNTLLMSGMRGDIDKETLANTMGSLQHQVAGLMPKPTNWIKIGDGDAVAEVDDFGNPTGRVIGNPKTSATLTKQSSPYGSFDPTDVENAQKLGASAMIPKYQTDPTTNKFILRDSTQPDSKANRIILGYEKASEEKPPAGVGSWDKLSDGEKEALIQGSIEGRIDPSKMSFRDRTELQGAAAQRDPSYNSYVGANRGKVAQDYMAGKTRNNIVAANTVVNHLATLQSAAGDLSSGDIQLVNKASNFIGKEFGNPNITNFNEAKTLVASEMANVYKQTGATDQEISAMENIFSPTMSPSQFSGAVDKAWELLGGRLSSIAQSWDASMGPSSRKPQILFPTTINKLRTIPGGNEDLVKKIDPYYNYEGDPNNFISGQGSNITKNKPVSNELQEFTIGGKKYRIPANEVEEFKKAKGIK